MSRRIDVVAGVMAAWGRHDIDGVIAHMADDVEWHYQVGSPPVTGKEHMRKVLDKLQHHQQDSTWRLTRWAEQGDHLMVEAVDDFTAPTGNRVQVPYMGAYDFEGDLIRGWRDYVDLGLMARATEGEDLGDWVQALVDAGTVPGP